MIVTSESIVSNVFEIFVLILPKLIAPAPEIVKLFENTSKLNPSAEFPVFVFPILEPEATFSVFPYIFKYTAIFEVEFAVKLLVSSTNKLAQLLPEVSAVTVVVPNIYTSVVVEFGKSVEADHASPSHLFHVAGVVQLPDTTDL